MTVLNVVDILPQPSLAVKVLVFERLQVEVITSPSLAVTVGMPHASVAVAVPKDASISEAAGLQDGNPGAVDKVTVGGVLS